MLQRSLDRRHHYKDVEELIDFGILTSCKCFGVTVIVRSLFPEEIRDITQRTHQQRCFCLSDMGSDTCTLFGGGVEVAEHIDIYKSVQRFPKKLVYFCFIKSSV